MGFFIFTMCVKYLPIFGPPVAPKPPDAPKALRGEIPKPSHATT
jgi:hypothetical protein